jgi:hypothetical protein
VSEAIAPIVWTLACLLILAGVAKLLVPGPAIGALRAVELPAGPLFVRLAALAEIVVGVWVLAAPSTAAMAALATAYLCFAGAVSRMRQAEVADCGCFGVGSFEPTALHLALNLVALVAAFCAVIAPPDAIGAVFDRAPLEAVALAAAVATSVFLAYLAYTVVPAAWNAYGGERR